MSRDKGVKEIESECIKSKDGKKQEEDRLDLWIYKYNGQRDE